MKKLLMGLFVFGFLFVGFQVHSAIAQESLSITLESNPQASNGTVTINLGDTITFTGFPNNLTGDITTDYTRSFNFDPIFDGVCNQNGSNEWSQKCIPTQAGIGTFSIYVTQNGHVYNSNVIRVIVTSNTPVTTITLESNPEVGSNGYATINLGDTITFTGFPNNLTGDITTDYTRSFNFDPIFDGVCNQNGSNEWSQKCIPTQAGIGTFSIYVTQNGHVYNSNVIKTKVVSDIPATLNTGCSNGAVYNLTTGQKCPTTDTSSVTVLSPNGGEVFTQGGQNRISWTGGKNKVQIGLFKKTNKTNSGYSGGSGIIGWIELNGNPNSSLIWDGIKLKSLDGNLISVPAPYNDYSIVALTESNEGNYCLKVYDSSPCSSDISDNTFTITSSTDTSCSAGEIYSSMTGKKCFEKDEVKDTGCIAGYNYSSMTGKPCALGLYKNDNTDVLNSITSSITRTLKRGIKGDDVKILQLFLNLAADGSFGPQTQAKVMEWQAAHGLTADGAFGRMSREKAGLIQ